MSSAAQKQELLKFYDAIFGTSKKGKGSARTTIIEITNKAAADVSINGDRLGKAVMNDYLRKNSEKIAADGPDALAEVKEIGASGPRGLGNFLHKKWQDVTVNGHPKLVTKRKGITGGTKFEVIFNSGNHIVFSIPQEKGKLDKGETGLRDNFTKLKQIQEIFFKEYMDKFHHIYQTKAERRAGIHIGHGQYERGNQAKIEQAALVQGRADVAEAMFTTFETPEKGATDWHLSSKLESIISSGRDTIQKMGLASDQEKIVNVSTGEYRFTETMYYELEAEGENIGKSEEAAGSTDLKEAMLQDIRKEVPEFAGDGTKADAEMFSKKLGSMSSLDIVGNMIVNTPTKKKMYNTKKAKNLTKYKTPKPKGAKRTVNHGTSEKSKVPKIELGVPSYAPPTEDRKVPSEKGTAGPENLLIGLTAMTKLMNKRLPKAVINNMGRPALRNRSGRFAESVNIESITPAARTLMVRYTYRLNPYETFEPGGARDWPSGYNPKPLISKSIRGLALEMFKITNLTTRRV